MLDGVSCGNCGRILDYDDGSKPPEERTPCPNCGSTARTFSVSATATINFEATASAEVFSSATLLLKAVVVPELVVLGKKTEEGRLITAVTVPWFEIIELLRKNPAIAHEISSRRWEEIIAGAYARAGWDEVILTPPSGDHGRDVIAIKRGLGSVRVIDQVKAYRPGHLVTANDVRALVGVLHGDSASKGFLTTTSDFAPGLTTDPLIVPFIPSRLELINGKALIKRLAELAR